MHLDAAVLGEQLSDPPDREPHVGRPDVDDQVAVRLEPGKIEERVHEALQAFDGLLHQRQGGRDIGRGTGVAQDRQGAEQDRHRRLHVVAEVGQRLLFRAEAGDPTQRFLAFTLAVREIINRSRGLALNHDSVATSRWARKCSAHVARQDASTSTISEQSTSS